MKQESRRIFWLDIARIAAMFAVVIIHLTAERWYDLPVKGIEWQMLNLLDSTVRWGVPVFVMISGALLLSKEIPVKILYKQNIRRLLIAFLFWSFIYAIIDCINGSGISRAVVHFVHGHGHMWYIFMIAGLYMIIPFLSRIIEDKKLLKYFLMLNFVFSFAVPQIINISAMVNSSLGEFFSYYVDKASIFLPLGYSGYFVLGYYIVNIEISKRKEYFLYVFGGVSLIITFLGTAFISRLNGVATSLLYDYLSVNVFFESVGVFLIIKRLFSARGSTEISERRIAHISNACFGIYLVHVLTIQLFERFDFMEGIEGNAVAWVIIASIFVFLFSMVISLLIRKIPKIGKLIV